MAVCIYFYTAGSDYSDVSRQLVFNPGQNRACFTVPIMDDQLNEGTERFVADITDVPSGVGIRNPSRTTISIEDDEGTMTIQEICPEKFLLC